MVSLPAPRQADRYHLAAICLGNICRSPIADVVLRDRVEAAGLADRVSVRSAGTGGWHVGDDMDPRSAATLRDSGYDPSGHVVQQVTATWLTECDVLLAMDRSNLRDLQAMARRGSESLDRIVLFGDFDPVDPGREVPDPYYGGADGFREVLTMIERAADAVVGELGVVLGRTESGR